jgi:site-specific DNA-cytosine methylase
LSTEGFECDSISPLNSKRKENQGCIGRGEGRSGTTAHAVMSYIAKQKPAFVLLENVKSMDVGARQGLSSDLQYLLAQLESLGYAADAELLTPLDYGCPQSRDRYLESRKSDRHFAS